MCNRSWRMFEWHLCTAVLPRVHGRPAAWPETARRHILWPFGCVVCPKRQTLYRVLPVFGHYGFVAMGSFHGAHSSYSEMVQGFKVGL